jgi:hypothetical protein
VAKPRREKPSFEQLLTRLAADFKNRLVPPLGGYVYRFTIYLPILSEGKEVFSSRQRFLLARLFHACFAGFSETTSEGTPPWYGSWSPAGAVRSVVDRHTLIVLYSPQVEGAKDFFRRLRWILEHDEDANQEVVLIEHVTAWLVEAISRPD